MIGIVVAGHGEFSAALVNSARWVVPGDIPVVAVSILAEDDSATYEPRLHDAVATVDGGDGVLVLTDMFGGTPSNVGMTMHQPGKVEMITGVNLPMLIKALQLMDQGIELSDLAQEVKAAGQRSIAIATQVLLGGEEDTDSVGPRPDL